MGADGRVIRCGCWLLLLLLLYANHLNCGRLGEAPATDIVGKWVRLAAVAERVLTRIEDSERKSDGARTGGLDCQYAFGVRIGVVVVIDV